MITEKDFKEVIMQSESIDSDAKECFELAKKMAVGFALWIDARNYRYNFVNKIWWHPANDPRLPDGCTNEQLLELYLNQK